MTAQKKKSQRNNKAKEKNSAKVPKKLGFEKRFKQRVMQFNLKLVKNPEGVKGQGKLRAYDRKINLLQYIRKQYSEVAEWHLNEWIHKHPWIMDLKLSPETIADQNLLEQVEQTFDPNESSDTENDDPGDDDDDDRNSEKSLFVTHKYITRSSQRPQRSSVLKSRIQEPAKRKPQLKKAKAKQRPLSKNVLMSLATMEECSRVQMHRRFPIPGSGLEEVTLVQPPPTNLPDLPPSNATVVQASGRPAANVRPVPVSRPASVHSPSPGSILGKKSERLVKIVAVLPYIRQMNLMFASAIQFRSLQHPLRLIYSSLARELRRIVLNHETVPKPSRVKRETEE